MIRFLHTSDWQLGAGFGQVPGDQGARLRRQRIETIATIAEIAEKQKVDFVLLAGDLFDDHSVSKEVIAHSCQAMARITCPVYIIPGNHDYAGSEHSVYRGKKWLESKPPHVHVYETTDPVMIADGQVVLYPCPLRQRRVLIDPTYHLPETLVDPAICVVGPIRIALAHGSVIGFGSEDEGTSPNLINRDVVLKANLDYLALGDWHGTLQVGEKVWYSGTPETDRFKENDSGNVLLVAIEKHGATPVVEKVRTSGLKWLFHSVSLRTPEDVTALGLWFSGLDKPDRTLIKLKVNGVLNLFESKRTNECVERMRDTLVHLRDTVELFLEPTLEELQSIADGGFMKVAVDKLCEKMAGGGTDGETARMALNLLYHYNEESSVKVVK
ncbi:MAG: DNA repair exonuclease [Verrucomicrobiota bacterium]|nr:DNA repair exonuclease [Verrucomicrobiota bacterium]